MSAAARDHVACEDKWFKGGGCCQDRDPAGAAGKVRADGRAAVVLRADPDVAAGREVRVGAGWRAAVAERVTGRRAGRGPVTGSAAAAAEPGVVGRGGGDEPGQEARRGRAGRCGAARPAQADGGRGAGRDGPGEAGQLNGRRQAPVPGLRRARRQRHQYRPSSW